MEKIGDEITEDILERKERDAFEMSNVSLKMNSYEDIFSSFDPRHYSERALSVDFLDEAKRATRDKELDKIELRLLIPEKMRRLDKEKVIRMRLKEHFERHARQTREKYTSILRRGGIFIILGVLTMLIASFLLFGYSESNVFIHFLLVLFEPAGWFFFWEGLYQVIFESKQRLPDFDFYQKMAKSSIIIQSY
ncbi:hypothetical protein HYW76_04660 [Candidatus Pacearchaeota archaeon]|nr:hypothetical protein [Candidatus Pacearchaeota archaeon]